MNEAETVAKRTAKRVSEAKRLRAEGRSNREIAEIVSKGGTKVTEGTIRNWLGPSSGPAEEPEPAVPPTPPDPPKPLDVSVMSPDDVVGLLTGLLRQQQESVLVLTSEKDHAGAQRATRVAAQLAALLQKQQAREDVDGDSVRVRGSDLAAAAERARSKLHDLVSRLSEERSR